MALILVSFVSTGALAGPDQEQSRYEIFSGADVMSGSVFGYFGGVWAFGRNVSDAGPRLKAIGGWGRYEYETALPTFPGEQTVNGAAGLLQVLGGYQWQRGDWTIKTYAGFSLEDHDLRPGDPDNPVKGSETGAIGQIELWHNLGPASFLSLDASFATAFDGYFLQGRLGKRPVQRLSLGIEAAALGNKEHDGGRGGAFIRFHLHRTDITISGGISSDYEGEDSSGYAALAFYSRF